MRPVWPSSQFQASQQVSTISSVVWKTQCESRVSLMQPEPLDRVEFGRVGRQEDPAEVFRHDETRSYASPPSISTMPCAQRRLRGGVDSGAAKRPHFSSFWERGSCIVSSSLRRSDVEHPDGIFVLINCTHLAIRLRWRLIQIVHRSGRIGKAFEKPVLRRQQGSGRWLYEKNPYRAGAIV